VEVVAWVNNNWETQWLSGYQTTDVGEFEVQVRNAKDGAQGFTKVSKTFQGDFGKVPELGSRVCLPIWVWTARKSSRRICV
jgi:hypothetical protein